MADQEYTEGDEVCCWCPDYQLWFRGEIKAKRLVGTKYRYRIKFEYYDKRYNKEVGSNRLIVFDPDWYHVWDATVINKGYIMNLDFTPLGPPENTVCLLCGIRFYHYRDFQRHETLEHSN